MSESPSLRGRRGSTAESKFVVDPAVGEIIREWARTRLAADPHGGGPHADQYRTASIYFDTPAYDVFHRRGSFARSKFRVRRYEAGDAVFLERKLTRPGVVTKRRTKVPLEALSHLRAADGDGSWAGAWFERRLRLRGLRPVCEVSYLRTARIGVAARGDVRLTIDEQVSARAADAAGFASGGARVPVLGPQWIVELKYAVEMPLLFKEFVERFGLAPRAASKYRLSVAALGCAGSDE